MQVFTAVMAITIVLGSSLDARGGGGRGGGGGHGGGGGRMPQGGRGMQRSPSMSRAAPARQAMPNRPVQRPNIGGGQSFPNRSIGGGQTSLSQRPSGMTATRGDVQKFLQSNPSVRPGERPGQILGDQSLGGRLNNRPGERPGTLPADRHNFGQNVRNEIGRDRPDRGNWFNNNFWNSHNHHPIYYDNRHNWWQWGSAAAIGAWLSWSTAPVYYDYGADNYWNASVDTGGGQVYAETTQMIDNAAATATAAAPEQANVDWLPLGVFALSTEGVAISPNIYMQLALNQQGMIAGTYYNTTTNQTYDLEGVVDQKSQRVAWKVVDSPNSPIVETGIYNLTQSEAPVKVHFQDGRTQQMVLVHLDEQQTA